MARDCQDYKERLPPSQPVIDQNTIDVPIDSSSSSQLQRLLSSNHGTAAEAIIYVAFPGLPPTQTTAVAFGPIDTTVSLSSTRAAREVSYGRASQWRKSKREADTYYDTSPQ